MDKREARKLFHSMEKTKAMGVSINPIAEQHIRDNYYKAEGIVLVYKCKVCGKTAECYVKTKGAMCNTHGPMNEYWDATKVMSFGS